MNVSGQVGWAPYVSDYSRHLPSSTSLRSSFWYTYGGSVLSAVIFAILGVLAGSVALNDIESNTVGYLATVVSANFVTDVSDFISFLLYIVIPWSAINLVDYYFVRRGNYDIPAIFTPNGPYGRVNVRTVIVFLVGIAVEIPFMNAYYPQFEGPVASALSGADISGWSGSWSRAACTTC